jgi:hypothetical protein
MTHEGALNCTSVYCADFRRKYIAKGGKWEHVELDYYYDDAMRQRGQEYK